MGARGGGRGGATVQKAAGRAPRHPTAGALSGGPGDAAQHQDHSARGPAGCGEMLRVRCLRGGSRGAEAVHYIGSRVRAPPASSPRFPQLALHDPVPSDPPWKLGFKSLCWLPGAWRCPRERGWGAGIGATPCGYVAFCARRTSVAVSSFQPTSSLHGASDRGRKGLG